MEALQRHLQYCSRPVPNGVLASLVIKLIHSTRDRTWRSSQFHFIPGSQWAGCRVKICSTEDEDDFEGFKFKKETDSYAYTSLNLYILADIKWYSIIIIASAAYHFLLLSAMIIIIVNVNVNVDKHPDAITNNSWCLFLHFWIILCML